MNKNNVIIIRIVYNLHIIIIVMMGFNNIEIIMMINQIRMGLRWGVKLGWVLGRLGLMLRC